MLGKIIAINESIVSVKLDVNIYDYEGNKVTEEDLDIPETSYSRVISPAFKVSKKDGNYVIAVLTGNAYVNHTYYTDRNTYKEKVEEEVPEVPDTPETPDTPPEESSSEESGS